MNIFTSRSNFGLILVLAGCGLLIVADHKNMLRICKIECVVGDLARPYIANESCSIKALSRYRTAINVEGYLLKPFDDILVNMRIFKKNSVTYLPYMVNVTTNVCKFLSGGSVGAAGFYTRFMIGWINKYSNINHSCPYSGYTWAKNLEPFADKIPVFAPTGDYRLELHFYESSLNNWLGVIRGYGTIKLRPFSK
ncbi:uncharacterized protein LOC119652012 [Hermetia illucens]|uniref:uncharacterized protein LOC119652012 n=1 Tax=Hermetia illucens TaxID=343691 RepID=UPI0018CC2A35|nr:uncharacterized protein LOC119652012 [Hermetia illucens]